MKKFIFDCVYDLADCMQTTLDKIDEDYPVISVYGHYKVIKTLLEDLIMNGVAIANEIELEDYDISHYDREFVLYLTTSGVNVEKTYRDNNYYHGNACVSFIHEDCCSKLLDYIDSELVYEFVIEGEEHHCCESCKKDLYIETIDDDDDNIVGFKVCEKTNDVFFGYSYCCSDGMNKDDIYEVLRKIGMV